MLQDVDLRRQSPHRGMVVGVAVSQCAQLGTLRGHLAQRVAQLRRALHGADEPETLDRRARASHLI